MARHYPDPPPRSRDRSSASPTGQRARARDRCRPTATASPDPVVPKHIASSAIAPIAATRLSQSWPAEDLEAAYHLGGWSLLLDEFDVPPDAQVECLEERAWERHQRAASRLRLLTAVSRFPAPDRDLLRAYLTTGLQIEVLAVLLGTSPERYWQDVTTVARSLLSELTPELLTLLPTELLDAVADHDATPITAIIARHRHDAIESDQCTSTRREAA